jgi:2,4-dienoyl-CoA reductase-like NADH-dependent reductase (Old Yellow Enzyme family)
MAIRLFQPIALRGVTLHNRIVVPSMTQFSCEDGVAGDWHLMHLGQFAVSGAGLVNTESTYVEARARNAPTCLSLYTPEQAEALARITAFFRAHGQSRLGVQLCHGGRKASNRPHWEGGGPLGEDEGGYRTVAPSAVPVKEGWPAPEPLDRAGIAGVIDAFAAAAGHALRAGADLIELHGAHGYLIHQFLSPITNRRGDAYGGNLRNRMRFALEIFEAVRAAWPDDRPIGIRVSATDWAEGGWTVAETVEFARTIEALGCDYIHVSSGGLTAEQVIETGPGYQIGFAAEVKAAVSMPVIAVGQITDPHQAESILRSGQADLVGVARMMLYNPRWVWSAARALGCEAFYPPQYERAHPSRWSLSGVSSPGNQHAEVR